MSSKSSSELDYQQMPFNNEMTEILIGLIDIISQP